MSELRSILERGVGGATPPPDGFERMLRRRDRKRRNQRISAAIVGIGIALVVAVTTIRQIVSDDQPVDRTPSPPPATSAAPAIGDVDMLVDLEDGSFRPVPTAIADLEGGAGDYQVSPDGSMLLFDGRNGIDWGCTALYRAGCPVTQIYVANVDGTGLRQVTNEVAGAVAGAWSPDGSRIAYVSGWGQRERADLYVVDLASGSSTLVADDLAQNLVGFPPPGWSPDGRSILFTGADRDLWQVPVDGGRPTRVHAEGMWGAYAADGSVVYLKPSYQCCGHPGNPEVEIGQGIYVVDADGTRSLAFEDQLFERLVVSPDGTRVAAARAVDGHGEVLILDIATGEVVDRVDGVRPAWFDEHTLIVEQTL